MKEIIEQVREQIKTQGFMRTMDVAMFLGSNGVEVEAEAVIEALPNSSIHRVEYANKGTEDYRRKDLFFYNPTAAYVAKDESQAETAQ